MIDPVFLGVLALFVVALWWMSSRTRKQQQAQSAFRDNLQPGQQVMTGSGLYATVVEVIDDTVVLEASPGVHTRWFKPAIAKLVEPPVPADEDLEDDEYADDEYADDELAEGEVYADDDLAGDDEYADDELVEGEEYSDEPAEGEEYADDELAAEEPRDVPGDAATTDQDDRKA